MRAALLLAIALLGCSQKSREATESDPAAGVLGGGGLDLEAGVKTFAPGTAPRPQVRMITDAGPPTPEESAQIPMPRFEPLIRDATRESKLPCPPGTTQTNGERTLECRASAKPGYVPSKEGPTLWFHKASGKLAHQGQYANNKRVGHWWSFREDGTLEEENAYVDGELDGVHVTYFPTGKRRAEGHYRGGKLHGPFKTWDEGGQLRSIMRYEDGVATERREFQR